MKRINSTQTRPLQRTHLQAQRLEEVVNNTNNIIMETQNTAIAQAQGIIVSNAQAVPQTYEELTALFVAEQDIRDSSRALYKRTLSQFFNYLEENGKSLNSLSVADINAYKDSLQKRGLRNLTIGSYIVAVRKFYEWAESKKWYFNIARGVKAPRRKEAFRKQHLSEEKTSELLTYFRKTRKDRKQGRKSPKRKQLLSAEALCRDYAIVNLMLRTGLRTIEVTRADIADIVFKRERRVLKVYGKGRSDKEEDFVVLSDSAYKPIEEYLSKYRRNAKAGEPLFTSVSAQNRGSRLTTRSISGLCKEGLKKIGLDGGEYTAHSLRHTTAVAVLKVTNNISEVQAVLRHRSVDTSKIYLKSIEEEMRLQKPTEYKIDSYFH